MTILSLVTAAVCSRGLESAQATLPAIGTPLPAFSYAGLDSGTVPSASLHGSPTVVALWSSTIFSSAFPLANVLLRRHLDFAHRLRR